MGAEMYPDLGAKPDVSSPYKLRRKITLKESSEIKNWVEMFRYDSKWDDAMFFTLAQAANVEGKKIYKQSPKDRP